MRRKIESLLSWSIKKTTDKVIENIGVSSTEEVNERNVSNGGNIDNEANIKQSHLVYEVKIDEKVQY